MQGVGRGRRWAAAVRRRWFFGERCRVLQRDVLLHDRNGLVVQQGDGDVLCLGYRRLRGANGELQRPAISRHYSKIDLYPSARPGAAVTGLPPPPAVNGGGSATATAVQSGPGRPRVCALAQLSAIIPIIPPFQDSQIHGIRYSQLIQWYVPGGTY